MQDDESQSHAMCADLGGQGAINKSQCAHFVRAMIYNAPIRVWLLHLFRGNACPNSHRVSLLKIVRLVGMMKGSLEYRSA